MANNNQNQNDTTRQPQQGGQGQDGMRQPQQDQGSKQPGQQGGHQSDKSQDR